MKVYVWADGIIGIGRKTPEGAIEIDRGRRKVLEEAVAAVSRLAYDGKTWIAPEVRDAVLTGGDTIEALRKYQERLQRAIDVEVLNDAFRDWELPRNY